MNNIDLIIMKLKNLFLPIVAFATIILSFVGCKPKTEQQPEVKTTVTITGAKTVEVGKTIRLIAKVVPANPKEKITWQTSDASLATVEGGLVKGIKAGEVTITAALTNGNKATHKVTVTGEGVAPKPEKTTIALDAKEKSLKVGESFTLKATLTPSDAKDKITWVSSATEVATVKNGKVTALKAGKSTITAKLENGNKAECVVTVTPKKEGGDTPTPPAPAPGKASFEFVENPITITMGDKLDLSKKIKFNTPLANGSTVTYKEVEVQTSQNDWKPLLVITANGSVTTNDTGTCEVKATRTDTNESITVKIIINAKTFKVPEGSKIVVTGGDGTKNVVSVKVQAESPFVLKAMVVDPQGKELKNIEITRTCGENIVPDFTNNNNFNTSGEGETHVTYTVEGTKLKTVVKVSLSFEYGAKPVYTAAKAGGVDIGIDK